jgi:hypothetical protein
VEGDSRHSPEPDGPGQVVLFSVNSIYKPLGMVMAGALPPFQSPELNVARRQAVHPATV